MKSKQIWFTSDLHLFHKHILTFDKRPFNNLDDMHRQIIINFNKAIGQEDDALIYFLGDTSFGGTKATKQILDQINSKKICILGNHDQKAQSMYNSGFDVVLQKAEIPIGKHLVTLSHCPLLGVPREDTTGMRSHVEGLNWHGENNKAHFSWENKGQFHLHGHIHSGTHRTTCTTIQGRQIDVGVCANDYRPLHISKIESWIDLTIQKEQATVVE
jgi:calcineurin-like phosphoesterase family protein